MPWLREASARRRVHITALQQLEELRRLLRKPLLSEDICAKLHQTRFFTPPSQSPSFSFNDARPLERKRWVGKGVAVFVCLREDGVVVDDFFFFATKHSSCPSS